MKKLFLVIALVSIMMCSTSFAAPIVLDFEGLANFEVVGNFYNGGAGTNYGIQFSDTSLALIDSDAGGSGNFGGEPSPDTVLFFLSGGAATMNVFAGFDTGFSFFYTSPFFTGSVIVYDGLNGLGNILATLLLPMTAQDGGDPTGDYSPFYAFGVSFLGTAYSVDFGGVADQIAFDNITLGSATPGGVQVPEPGTLLLLGSGLAGLAVYRRRMNKA